MKSYMPPPVWDSKKFATRYGLSTHKDFYVDTGRRLLIFPDIPDDPPIFETATAEGPLLADQLRAAGNNITQIAAILIQEAANGYHFRGNSPSRP